MAKQTINNAESGLDVRGKINDNFSELYAVSVASPNATVSEWVPQGFTGQAIGVRNSVTPNDIGSLTSGTLASTNERTRRKRTGRFTTAAANLGAGIRAGANAHSLGYRGDQAGRGGFLARFRFALNLVPSGYRLFVGLMPDGNAPNVVNDPSTYVSCIGIGKDAADTQFYLMHNDGSGTATKVPISTSDIPITADAVIELTLTCPRGDTQNISYEAKTITGIDSSGNDTYGTPVTGTISTDLPATLTPLFPLVYINSGSATTDTRIDFLKYVGVTYGD